MTLKEQKYIYLFTLMHSFVEVCRAVEEALERGSPAVIDSYRREALLSGSEALSITDSHVQCLSLSARNSCKKLFKPDKHMCQTRV